MNQIKIIIIMCATVAMVQIHAVHVDSALVKRMAALRMFQKQNLQNGLLFASSTGNLKTVLELIKQKAPVNGHDHERMTPLMHAAGQGNGEITAILLKNGAQINAQDHTGQTALHHAIKKKRMDIVTLLMTYNPNMTIKNKQGQTAADLLEESSLF
jgi:uncharacterized protein